MYRQTQMSGFFDSLQQALKNVQTTITEASRLKIPSGSLPTTLPNPIRTTPTNPNSGAIPDRPETPSWLLPVGIAAVAGIALLMFVRNRRKA